MVANSTNNIFTKKIDIQRAAVNTIFAAMLFAGILFLHYNRPVLYMGLIMEDYWGEYATFVCYMLAFAFPFWGAVKNKNLRKPGYLILALTMFVIGMEEISWGQRVFNFETPYRIAKLNLQSELTIHNMIDNDIPIHNIFFYAVVIWGFILPLFLRFNNRFSSLAQQWGIPKVAAYDLPYFIISLAFFVFHPVIKSDEIQEMLLAYAFASFSKNLFFNLFGDATSPLRIFILRKIVLSLVVITMTGALVSQAGVTIPRIRDQFSGQIHWFASTKYPERGLYRQAEQLFDYILQDKDLIKDTTLVQFGILLVEMKSRRAESILSQALDNINEMEKTKTNDQNLVRTKGVILKLLGQRSQAQVEFQKSIAIDLKRLENDSRDSEKPWITLSMAKTYIVMEDYESALPLLKEILNLAPPGSEKLKARDFKYQLEKQKTISFKQYLNLLRQLY